MSDTPSDSQEPAPPAEPPSEPRADIADAEVTSDADSAPTDAAPPVFADVWSRTEPRYRVRAFVLLVVNFILFCGLCVFTHWLHSAKLFSFSYESYIYPFRFWGPETQSLNDFLLAPINVVQTPIHGVVLGLLVASIVAVPIVVAMLYRFPASVPFAAAIAVFAHMPWMGVTLMAGCVLASLKPFRLSFRYGSALLGLLPVLLYLYMATRVSPDQLGMYSTPEQRTWLIAPWIVAILAAAAMLGLILLISWIVNYRPGAVAPVLAGALLLPSVIFHTQVGSDELAYRVIEANYGPRSPRFKPVEDVGTEIVLLIRQYQLQPGDVMRALKEGLGGFRRRAIRHYMIELLQDRSAANQACERFIVEHPTSRYIPCVLYVQARALDTRLAEESLLPMHADSLPVRELYTDFPHPQSERAWSVLWNQYADSPLAVVAAVRLAELHVRRGEVDAALLRLLPVVNRAQAFAPVLPTTTQPSWRGLLASAPAEASLEIEPEPYLRDARGLHRLITLNRNDPKYADEPLIAYHKLNARRAGYRAQLLVLMEQFPDSFMYDNLLEAWASSAPEIDERAWLLEGCIARLPTGDHFPNGKPIADAWRDALPEALYHLAGLEIQALREKDPAARARGIARLRELINQHGRTIWALRAADDLARLEPGPPDVPETESP